MFSSLQHNRQRLAAAIDARVGSFERALAHVASYDDAVKLASRTLSGSAQESKAIDMILAFCTTEEQVQWHIRTDCAGDSEYLDRAEARLAEIRATRH